MFRLLLIILFMATHSTTALSAHKRAATTELTSECIPKKARIKHRKATAWEWDSKKFSDHLDSNAGDLGINAAHARKAAAFIFYYQTWFAKNIVDKHLSNELIREWITNLQSLARFAEKEFLPEKILRPEYVEIFLSHKLDIDFSRNYCTQRVLHESDSSFIRLNSLDLAKYLQQRMDEEKGFHFSTIPDTIKNQLERLFAPFLKVSPQGYSNKMAKLWTIVENDRLGTDDDSASLSSGANNNIERPQSCFTTAEAPLMTTALSIDLLANHVHSSPIVPALQASNPVAPASVLIDAIQLRIELLQRLPDMGIEYLSTANTVQAQHEYNQHLFAAIAILNAENDDLITMLKR